MANVDGDDRGFRSEQRKAELTAGDSIILAIAAFAVVWTLVILATRF